MPDQLPGGGSIVGDGMYPAAPADPHTVVTALTGHAMPSFTVGSTDGEWIDLSELGPGRTVIYLYPRTAGADGAVPAGWDEIPGARGCTPEACAFRDHHAELQSAGAAAVFGLSSQTVEYQREAIERLHLPFALLSDPTLELAARLSLPTFEADGARLYRRLTVIVRGDVIEKVFYPVDDPAGHAGAVLSWLRSWSS